MIAYCRAVDMNDTPIKNSTYHGWVYLNKTWYSPTSAVAVKYKADVAKMEGIASGG